MLFSVTFWDFLLDMGIWLENGYEMVENRLLKNDGAIGSAFFSEALDVQC